MKFSILYIFILLISDFCFAQEDFGSLMITTKTTQDSVLKNVEIKLFVKDSILVVKTKTDSTGSIHIKDLIQGSYTIEASKSNFDLKYNRHTLVASNKISFVTLKLETIAEANERINKSSLCEYVMTKRKPKCHICNSKKEVIRYVYGLPRKETIKKSEDGLIMLGGCMFKKCQPYWYCKKDTVDVIKIK